MKPLDRKALEAAQDLMWTAMETAGRAERIKLAEKALSLSAHCADAYVYLAYDREKTKNQKIAMFEEGVKAGRRALGTSTFKEDVGAFWGLTETRPFMRALFGLAQTLQESGRIDEALVHYKELLRLNPNDNQGVRCVLIPLLISQDKTKEALALVKKYPDDTSPEITYSLPLLLYKKHGDSEVARAAVGEAVKWNRHVLPFLLTPKLAPIKDNSDYVTMGGKDEAYEYARYCRELWHKTPGAIDWLIEIIIASYIEHNKLHISSFRDLQKI